MKQEPSTRWDVRETFPWLTGLKQGYLCCVEAICSQDFQCARLLPSVAEEIFVFLMASNATASNITRHPRARGHPHRRDRSGLSGVIVDSMVECRPHLARARRTGRFTPVLTYHVHHRRQGFCAPLPGRAGGSDLSLFFSQQSHSGAVASAAASNAGRLRPGQPGADDSAVRLPPTRASSVTRNCPIDSTRSREPSDVPSEFRCLVRRTAALTGHRCALTCARG